MQRLNATVFALCTIGIAGQLFGQEPEFTDQQLEFFEAKVRPILVKHCYECHGPDADEFSGSLSLASRKDILKGGDSGPAVVPGKPDESLLIDSISYEDLYEMPPAGKMPDKDIEVLTKWVEMGAPWPKASDVAVEREGELNIQERINEHWCWQSITSPAIPAVKQKDWPMQSLDFFILNQLESKGLVPATPADRRTLIRRAYFDLVGLPPTPEQIESFVNDRSPKAFEKVVDELLASPHFGERWARHWMDLTRYAETCGHEFDYPLPYAHQYRDYLIRAFNVDVPYDKFITEHIAGDLIDNPRIHPTEKFNESVLGTGFWFLGEATHGPVDVKGDEAGRVDNQIDVMTKTFLGLTVACARCHDHKFDAISTKDYYALAGFLQSSRRQEVMMDVGGKIGEAKDAIRPTVESADKLVAETLRSIGATDVEQLAQYLQAASGIYADDTQINGGEEIVLEGEKLKTVETTGGSLTNQRINPTNNFKWSQNEQSWWRDAKVGDTWKLELPVSVGGQYEVFFDLTKARDYAIVEVFVDDKKLGDQVDLYDANLSKTGRISFGKHEFASGNRSLVFKVVGHNENAIPARMVGIDYVVLRPVPETPEQNPTLRTVTSEARRFSLDQKKLQRFVDAFKSPLAQNNNHPLYSLVKAAALDDDFNAKAAGRIQNGLKKSESQAVQRREEATLFADFDNTEPEGWFFTGEAYDEDNTNATTFDASTSGMPVALSGTSHSGRYGGKFYGVLRSPTFKIQSDKIHLRMNAKNAQVRLIIDGFEMDRYNALLFNGVTTNHNTDGQYQWVTLAGDIRNYHGHRAYLEIKDHSNGFVSIDEIWFSNGAAPSDFPSEIAQQAIENSSKIEELCRKTADGILGSVRSDDVSASDRYFASNALVNTLNADFVVSVQEIVDRIDSMDIPQPQFAVGMTEGTPENEYVFVRGNHKSLGPVAPRKLITALTDEETFAEKNLSGSGRMKLAREIATIKNPLTARVAVNRVWHHLTGRGIVESVDNFGVLGKAPTHPELLDFLSKQFVEDGWSMKRLIRRIMLSRTYQLASTTHPENVEKIKTIDPDNNYLHQARVRRLQGEVIRDSLLAIAGRLDRKMYGPSVPVYLTPFMQGRGRPGKSGPMDGNGRRSVYLAVRRNFLSPMMLAFDTPIPFNTIGKRNVSNVPAQALIMMNNPLVIEMSEQWGKQIAQSDLTTDARIEGIYVTALGRKPSEKERELALAFLGNQATEYAIDQEQLKNDARPWSDLCHVVFNVKEFIYLK